MEYAIRGRVGGLGLEIIRQTIFEFVPQNPGRDSEEERGGTWQNHIGCIEAKEICAGSITVRSTGKELDQNTPVVSWHAPKYSGANEEYVIVSE
jgi:hypothetical protein